MGRLLVFNCHEAWVHQLRRVPHALDILVDLPGRDVRGWDHAVRPLPENARCVPWGAHGDDGPRYEAVIGHSLADMRDARRFRGPRIAVFHATLEGRVVEEGAAWSPDQLRRHTAEFLRRERITPIAISALKARSWGLAREPLPPGIDVDDYPVGQLELARGIRVANHVRRRSRILRWSLHEAAFDGLPLTLVGHNPGEWAAERARSWDHLKQLLGAHRFAVHTVDPQLEDGYNLAVLEAMAAGLPVLGSPHPTSPVEHGVTGYLSDDAAELRTFAEALLRDRDLARRLGARAREAVREAFPIARFVARFETMVTEAAAHDADAAVEETLSGRIA